MENVQAQTVASIRLPMGDYQRVIEFAQRRGLVFQTGRPNLSEALRVAITKGLDVIDREAAANGANNS
jgi:hypothetical protein